MLQGTGGVSVAAAQIAVAAGLRVIITSSSDEKLETAKALGVHVRRPSRSASTVSLTRAQDVINYKTTPDWEQRVLELTGGRGADLVLNVGGGETLSRSLRAVRFGGQVVIIGALGGGMDSPPDLLVKIWLNNVHVRGITLGDVILFKEFVRLVDVNRIKPVVGKVFEFKDAKEAYACLEKQNFVGKVVIRVAKN